MSDTHTEVPTAYPPSDEFAAQANATADLYREAEKDLPAFWAAQANRLSWATPFTEVLDWSEAPFAKWFVGGKLNVAYNCVDRHVEAGNGDRVAIRWEGEPVGDSRTLTYSDLLAEVCKAANALTDLGLVAGDRVAIYMPMVPEAIVAMLACARLGIMHSVVFAGFSASALKARIEDAEAKLVITTDGQFRRGKAVSLKESVDEAVDGQKSVEHVLVVRRTGIDTPWTDGRDLWWHDTVDNASPEHTPEAFDAEHPLFLLYTSGTTGKPKGIMHTSGGFLTQASYTHYNVFDVKPETDVFWCTADIGWVTGHTYIVYGPLSNGVTQVVYEGTPASPNEHRHFEVIEKYGVTIYYTAPTLIRTFMKWGRTLPAAHDLSSLRLLGSVGEPINPEAWRWYREFFGADRDPDRGHLVADRDRGHHDLAAARGHRRQARLGDDTAARHLRQGRRRRRQRAAARRRRGRARHRIPGARPAVAVDAARHLGRSRTVQGDLLVPVRRAGLVLRRRRRPLRLRRQHLGAGPHRRRDERLRSPDLHRRGGVRAGRPFRRGRGRGGRAPPTSTPARPSARSSSSRRAPTAGPTT